MKHYEKRRSVSSKLFVMMLALVLVFGCAVGGTIAWLTAETDEVVNTFTYGDINIELTETKPNNKQAKIIPGVDIEKDPKVTVKAGSEACWLFVKVAENNWPTFTEADGTKKVSYSVVTGEGGWTKLTGVAGVDNVYYREVSAVTADTEFGILTNNKVTVSENLTKEDIKDLTNTHPTLTFTAYAVQKDGIDSAADAWVKIPSNTTNP